VRVARSEATSGPSNEANKKRAKNWGEAPMEAAPKGEPPAGGWGAKPPRSRGRGAAAPRPRFNFNKITQIKEKKIRKKSEKKEKKIRKKSEKKEKKIRKKLRKNTF